MLGVTMSQEETDRSIANSANVDHNCYNCGNFEVVIGSYTSEKKIFCKWYSPAYSGSWCSVSLSERFARTFTECSKFVRVTIWGCEKETLIKL